MKVKMHTQVKIIHPAQPLALCLTGGHLGGHGASREGFHWALQFLEEQEVKKGDHSGRALHAADLLACEELAPQLKMHGAVL